MQTEYCSSLDIRNTLEEYDFIETIGNGPCSTTYKVKAKSNGKFFALRTMPLYSSLATELQGLWQKQADMLHKLHSPQIEQIISSGETEQFRYSLKEFIHNGQGGVCNLRSYLTDQGGKLSEYDAYFIILYILQGLEEAYFHLGSEHAVCHGHLKPENILIAHANSPQKLPGTTLYANAVSFEVVLTDFQPLGLIDQDTIVKHYQNCQKNARELADQRLEQNVRELLPSIYRCYDYQAPEHSFGKIPTVQSDLFSVGVILYELLTGTLPCGNFPMPSALRPELHPAWDEIIHNCLQYYSEGRYQAHRECLDQIKNSIRKPSLDFENDTRIGNISQMVTKKGITPKGMVYIPAATFNVGGEGCGSDALPLHECTTRGFYLDRTSVTYDQFAYFVEQTGYITEAETTGFGAPVWMDGEWRILPDVSWRNPFGQTLPAGYGRHPVTQVTFADAQKYAQWLGRRLPTEQEWEYAARGGHDHIKYPWGNYLTRKQANFSGSSTSEVMQYPANYFGLYDIVGNVWQWTDSWYERYPGCTLENANFGKMYRVLRGGAWMYDVAYCMISFRNANQPDRCYPTVGFRTACDL